MGLRYAVISPTSDSIRDDLARLAGAEEGLRFLVLFGSCARWCTSGFGLGLRLSGRSVLRDPDSLLAALVTRLGSDRVDLTDLARAGAQLRRRVAAEGRVVYAADEDVFPGFCVHRAATRGPQDLRLFLARLRDQLTRDETDTDME